MLSAGTGRMGALALSYKGRTLTICICRIVCWIGTSSFVILQNKHILSDLGFHHPVVSMACS